MSDSDSDSKSDISVELVLESNMAAKYDMQHSNIRYSGHPDDDLDLFISKFRVHAELRDFTDPKAKLALLNQIEGNAREYLNSIASEDKDSVDKIAGLLKTNYEGSAWKWGVEIKLLSRKQLISETLYDYACDIMKWCRQLDKQESEHMSIFVRGLTLIPSVRGLFFRKNLQI